MSNEGDLNEQPSSDEKMEMNTRQSVPEPGTRFRTLTARGILVDGYELDHKLYFGNYYIHLNNEYPSIFYLEIFALPSPGTPGKPAFLGQYFESHTVDLDLKVFSKDGQELYQAHFVIKDRCARPHFPEYFFKCESFVNQTVDFQITFNKIVGLDIPPLRDYSVPNNLSDIVLIVEGKKFHLNKGFLASQSPYFEKLLFGDFFEKSVTEITLNEVSSETFTDLLDVLHHDLDPIHNKEQLFPLLKLADQWDVTAVFSILKTVLQGFPDLLNPGEKLWIFDKYDMSLFLQQSLNEWKKSYSSQVTKDMFNELSDSTKFALFRYEENSGH